VNPQTGIPYEDELCKDSNPIGVVVLGDSASAHFSIPIPNPFLNHTSPSVNNIIASMASFTLYK
jgi:hypothetical protein